MVRIILGKYIIIDKENTEGISEKNRMKKSYYDPVIRTLAIELRREGRKTNDIISELSNLVGKSIPKGTVNCWLSTSNFRNTEKSVPTVEVNGEQIIKAIIKMNEENHQLKITLAANKIEKDQLRNEILGLRYALTREHEKDSRVIALKIENEIRHQARE